jgi:hypothetical protein
MQTTLPSAVPLGVAPLKLEPILKLSDGKSPTVRIWQNLLQFIFDSFS